MENGKFSKKKKRKIIKLKKKGEIIEIIALCNLILYNFYVKEEKKNGLNKDNEKIYISLVFLF